MSSHRPAPHDHASRGRLPFPGPLLLLFPLLAFAIGVARLQHRRPTPGGYPTAPSQGSPQSAEAWIGRAGQSLRATLTRLHADADRQAFETEVLRRRLNLGPGEPWKLELRYDLSESAAARALELSALGVRDAQGLRLWSPAAPAPPPSDGVADPVAVWFSPPTRIEPGVVETIFLWGEEPGGDALLIGAGSGVLLWRGFHELPLRGSLLARLEEEGADDQGHVLDRSGDPDAKER